MVWDLWYYDQHIASNADWNLNQLDPKAVSPEARARILKEVRQAPGVAAQQP
jgi:hypothetical protein